MEVSRSGLGDEAPDVRHPAQGLGNGGTQKLGLFAGLHHISTNSDPEVPTAVTNCISFHARVGCFSPFCIRWSVAIAVISFWLHLVVLVSPCFLGPRIPRDYRFPRAPLFLYSERKPS